MGWGIGRSGAIRLREGGVKVRPQVVLFPLALVGLLVLFVLLERSPGYFANTTYLGGILALQIACGSLGRFEDLFFPLMMGSFLWGGSDLPFAGIGMSLRWVFLAVGALGGFIIWIKSQRQRHFAPVHLAAAFCVVAALVSATVSETPKTAVLKALSLFLLFLYATSGGRLAVAGREKKFLNGLILACEALVYVTVGGYFVLGFDLFGNPNALGAITGVAMTPILLWGALVADSQRLRRRRFVALALCGVLLYYSNSRASILGAAVAVVVCTVALRHQRLLFQCALASVFFLALMAVVNPSHLDSLVSSFTEKIYKENRTNPGVFGSRLSPWAETISVVKQHPWFGSGFGTSGLGELRPDIALSSIYTMEGTNREHGNSYLAMAEYMGLLGAAPFAILLLILVRAVMRVGTWMRRTGSPYHYAIPFALVAIAGLVHAFFEDWLFAVGSYLCVFFWVAMFALMDLVPDLALVRSAPTFTTVNRAIGRPVEIGADSILARNIQ
jgi:O-antigen ligase